MAWQCIWDCVRIWGPLPAAHTSLPVALLTCSCLAVLCAEKEGRYGVNQLQVAAGYEVWQGVAGLQDHSEIAPPGEMYARLTEPSTTAFPPLLICWLPGIALSAPPTLSHPSAAQPSS